MNRLCFIFFLLSVYGKSQLLFDQQNTVLGNIPEAVQIKGDVIIKNNSAKKIFLLRADAENGLKVYVSKKTLIAGDTCLMIISFVPEKNGKFSKKIDLIASDQGEAYILTLTGNILNIKPDNKTACFYFGSHKTNFILPLDKPLVVEQDIRVKDNSNKIPDKQSEPEIVKPKETKTTQQVATTEAFSKSEYKPNNLLFLVDVSSSMRDSLKLPVMKNALHLLIDKVRDIDSITFITYASKVHVLNEALSGSEKKKLHALVDSLKAKGMTSGNKAILMSQQLAQKHFIKNGNNQIILATDGEFKFEKEDYAKWKENQNTKKIILSTVAFGQDKKALKNLKRIAEQGEGSFIPINSKSGSSEKLLSEIKERSRITANNR